MGAQNPLIGAQNPLMGVLCHKTLVTVLCQDIGDSFGVLGGDTS